MPHGTDENTMSNQTPTVNGDLSNSHQAHSQTIDHVKSYPLVLDLSTEFQKNSLGAKSISTFNYFYANFAEPVFPYLQTPFSIIKPYLLRADSIGDSSLNKVDEKFPATKSADLKKVKTSASDIAYYPFRLVGRGRDYLFSTYNDEYKKIGGHGVFTHGQAIISTELRVAADALHAVGDYLGPKKDELQSEYEDLKRAGEQKLEKTKKSAHEKKNQVLNSS